MSANQRSCTACGSGLTAAGYCARCALAGIEPDVPGELREPSPDGQYAPGTAVRYFGHFELLDGGRAGGMGVVYRARQMTLKREVGLKMIQGHCLRSAVAVQRFRAEVEALARMDHPNVLPVYEVGEQRGQHYYSMKWVGEGSLRDQMGRWGLAASGEIKQGQRRVVELVLGVVRGVEHAHRRGILHRDLKPGNVLVDGAGQAYVADFGLAKFVEEEGVEATRSGAVLGSPAYMSPEQAGGKNREVTVATDVWALGVMLYELLTGRLPFGGDEKEENVLDVRRRVVEVEAEGLRRVDGRIDRDLETICLKCLEKDPLRRYRSAEALGGELERWLGGEPIEARPATGFERLGKWVRRRPVVAGWIGATTLALVLGLTGTTWQWRRAASRAASEARLAARIQISAAVDRLDRGDFRDGVARLSDVIRRNPRHEGAREALATAFVHGRWTLPMLEPLHHAGPVQSAMFGLDGRQLLTLSGDGTATLWRIVPFVTKALELSPELNCTAVDLSADGSQVAVASANRAVMIYDSRTGARLHSLPQPSVPRHLAFSPAPGELFVVSDTEVCLWSSTDGTPITGPYGQGNVIECADISKDGTRVVIGRGDGTVQIWHARTGLPLHDLVGHTPAVDHVRFSPDGRWVAACGNGTLGIWDAESGQSLTRISSDVDDFTNFAFSPDSARLATASLAGFVHVWSVFTGQVLGRAIRHGTDVDVVAFSPNSLLVLSMSRLYNNAKVWNVRTGELESELLGHSDGINAGAFSPDGTRIVTAGNDRVAILWDARPGYALPEEYGQGQDRSFTPRRVVLGRHGFVLASRDSLCLVSPSFDAKSEQRAKVEGHIACLDMDSSARRVAVGRTDGVVMVWDRALARFLKETEPRPHGATLVSLAPDASRCAVGYEDGTAEVMALPPLTESRLRLEHSGRMQHAVFSPDGALLVTAADDGNACVWDVLSGRQIFGLLTHPPKALSDVIFSPDGKKIITACEQVREVRVWSVSTGGLEAVLPHPHDVFLLRFSPEGALLAAVTFEGALTLWEATTGWKFREQFELHDTPIAVEFSPDAKRLVTATIGGVLRTWRTDDGIATSVPLRVGQLGDQVILQRDPFRVVAMVVGNAQPVVVHFPSACEVDDRLLSLAHAISHSGMAQRLPQGEEHVGAIRLFREVSQVFATSPAKSLTAWLVSDRGNRSIAPNSIMSLESYLTNFATEAHFERPETAALRSPEDPAALVRMAQVMAYSVEGPIDTNLAIHAEFISRLPAGALDNHPSLAVDRLNLLLNLGFGQRGVTEATEAVRRAPANSAFWRLLCRFEAQVGKGGHAPGDFRRVAPLLTNLVAPQRLAVLRERARLLQDTIAGEAARTEFVSALNLPQRHRDASRFLVDLCGHYNASPIDDWHNPQDRGNNLASLRQDSLPDGLLELGGVTFDARGIVQLSSSELRKLDPSFPEQIGGIPVAQTARRIHFLHGVGWLEQDGIEVARYVVRFDDGAQAEVPVVYGEHVRNWQFWPEGVAKERGGAEPVWRGPQERWRTRWPDAGVRLYRTTWVNPRPDVAIRSLDFISTMTKSAPFLIAVTVE